MHLMLVLWLRKKLIAKSILQANMLGKGSTFLEEYFPSVE